MDWFSPTSTCDRNARAQGVSPAVKWAIMRRRRRIINDPKFDLFEQLDLVRLEKFRLFSKEASRVLKDQELENTALVDHQHDKGLGVCPRVAAGSLV